MAVVIVYEYTTNQGINGTRNVIMPLVTNPVSEDEFLMIQLNIQDEYHMSHVCITNIIPLKDKEDECLRGECTDCKLRAKSETLLRKFKSDTIRNWRTIENVY